MSQSMDLSQASQMLRWLDAEQRKNKLLIAEQERQLKEQHQLIINLARRIESLESRLSETRSELHKFDLVEKNLEQTRGEASALLPRFEHALREAVTQLTQARLNERERDQRAIHELALKLELLPELQRRVDQNVQSHLADRERDTRALQELAMRLEVLPDIQRRLEVLPLEDRRLSEQIPPINAKLEQIQTALQEQATRFPILDEWRDRLSHQIAELRLLEDRIKNTQIDVSESVRRAEEHQRQQLALWGQDILEHRKQVDEAIRNLPPLSDLYDQARRVLAHYEGLDEEIRSEQTRITHLLELSETRLRETLAEWRAEYEKNWEHHQVNFDLYRKQQRELADLIQTRLDELVQKETEDSGRWASLREAWSAQTRRQLLELERSYKELEESLLGKKTPINQDVVSNQ